MKKLTALFILIAILGLSFSALGIIRLSARSTTADPNEVIKPLQKQDFIIEVLVPDQVISIDLVWHTRTDRVINPVPLAQAALKEVGKNYNIKNGIAIAFGGNLSGYVIGGPTKALILFVEPKKKTN